MSDPDQPEIRLGSPSIGMYKLDDSCRFAEQCETQCPVDLEAVVSELGSSMIASLCMRDAMQGEEGNEYVIYIRMHCEGPRKSLFRRTPQCGAKVGEPEIIKSPFGFPGPSGLSVEIT